MLHKQLLNSRLSLAAIGIALTLAATACGSSGGSAASKVATLDRADTNTETASTTPVDTQDALLAYAACMRENGVDMADPTFDADGNPTSRLMGPDSGIDPQSEEFQAAQTACGDLLDGVTFGGPGQGGGLDRDAIQESMNDFTACLRDEGLDVDDIDFADGAPGGPGGPGAGGFGAQGTATDGSTPAAVTPADGSAPAGGGGFGPPPGANGQGPGTDGFDPTARIVERLGLDADDPAVTAAIDACQSILDSAFQPTDTTAN